MRELIINKKENVENIILLDNYKLIEYYTNTEEEKARRLEGNIYIAEVKDVINGMQAAFVEFGDHVKGFIHLKDSYPQIDQTKHRIDENIKINDILKPKQKILVQIKKDSDKKKGARVSTHISLPGRYIVLMPNTDIITISKKIESENDRKKLISLIKTKLPNNFGVVVRTSCLNASSEEIEKDLSKLLALWNQIQNKYNKNKDKNVLIWESENIPQKIITDLGESNIDKIVLNNKEEYEKYKTEYKSIEVIYENMDLIEKYDLNNQIEKIRDRKIWLNCGAFITIDKTEALTAIDVNTGKFTGKDNLESTLFKVNKEATTEIAKQLRLRDIGGIIIIDYIDMKNQENKNKILELLAELLKNDRAKTQIEGFTKLNLMELTRKHICSHINT